MCSEDGPFKENEYRSHGKKDGKISNGMNMGTRKRKRKEHHEGKKTNYPITQEDCQPHFKVNNSKVDMWKVMTFEEDHSHVAFTPSKTHFI